MRWLFRWLKERRASWIVRAGAEEGAYDKCLRCEVERQYHGSVSHEFVEKEEK